MMKTLYRQSDRRRRHPRSGISTIWVILWLPVLLCLLCVGMEVANMLLARIELEHAMESAALSAVNDWGDNNLGDTLDARNVGVDYAATNQVRGNPVSIMTNYNAGNLPNQNASCDGNLIFGAITTEMPPHTFNAGIEPSCFLGEVFIDATKFDSGNDTSERMLGIFFDDGPNNISIQSVSFTIPIFPGVAVSQQPYFDADKPAVVSLFPGPDFLNRFNMSPAGVPPTMTYDARGIDPTPTVLNGGNPQFSTWSCPNGGAGNVCFTFSDPVPFGTDRFRTFTVHFENGTFKSTGDPNTTDFIRIGASINGLDPPALPPGSQNNGDGFGQGNVLATVVFFDENTMTTDTGSGTFVDVPAAFRSEVTVGGPGALPPAVRAQATVDVPSICGSFLGIDLSIFKVSARSTAVYNCETGKPRLIRINQFICPGP